MSAEGAIGVFFKDFDDETGSKSSIRRDDSPQPSKPEFDDWFRGTTSTVGLGSG
eukprot:ANDGO_02309.mRNA.1 hypothetical protein